MSRHGNGGSDNSYDARTWLPGGYGGQAEDDVSTVRRPAGRARGAHRRPEGLTQTSPGGDRPARPRLTEPGWDDTGISGAGPDPGAMVGKHPSEPLPSLPLPEDGWADPRPAFGYPGDADHEPALAGFADHSGGDWAGDRDDDTGYGYVGTAYDLEGYPETGYYPGYDDAGTGYPMTGDIQPVAAGSFGPETDHYPGYDDTGTGYPVTGDVLPVTAGSFADTGAGYFDPVYGDGRFAADAGRYPDDGAYLTTDDGQYLRYDEPTAGHRDRDDDHGWYPQEQPDWEQDDDSGFVPGMGTGGQGGGGDRADERAPGRGGRRGGTGPGNGGPGRAGAGKAGNGPPRGGGESGGGKRKSRMRRLAPWLALSVVLALLLVAGGGYYYVYTHYLHPPDFSGPGTGSLVVRIYPGDTASVVGQRLQREGVVASARAFSNAAKVSGQGTALEPGYYRVHLHMSAALAFALLLKPSSRVQTKITIPEGWRLSQIIAALGQATGNPRGYQQAIKNVAALGLPSFAHGHPEGYLFPATYDVQPNTPPIKVLQAMVTRFGQEAASVSLPAAAAHAQLTEDQVITVASLIQAEGRNPADFPKIARVIYNRLNANPQMKLQLDSTVMYALHRYGIIATIQQIKVNSPYNTYLHTGLPPGPIDSPGDTAIKAALHPAAGPWTYFVTVDPKTGLTKFTSNFTQFEQFRAQMEANIAKGR